MFGNGGRSDGPGPSGGEGLPSAKPLKINRDLLIYNGRLELRKSRNTFNAATKRRLLDRCPRRARRALRPRPAQQRPADGTRAAHLATSPRCHNTSYRCTVPLIAAPSPTSAA